MPIIFDCLCTFKSVGEVKFFVPQLLKNKLFMIVGYQIISSFLVQSKFFILISREKKIRSHEIQVKADVVAVDQTAQAYWISARVAPRGSRARDSLYRSFSFKGLTESSQAWISG